MKKSYPVILFVFLSAAAFAQSDKKPFQPSDFYKIPTVSDPQVSPDGQWIAYSVAEVDTAKDKRVSHLWMQSWDGKQSIELNHGPEPASKPSGAPMASTWPSYHRANQKDTTQLWLMDRRGGEGNKLTDIKGDLGDYAWSPDGQQGSNGDRRPGEKLKEPKTPKPIVVDRYHFKQDYSRGYLENRTKHLYLFDIATKKLDTLNQRRF
jgi:dipeptidyl aminopeptidase/acylaminoacyl peptidase